MSETDKKQGESLAGLLFDNFLGTVRLFDRLSANGLSSENRIKNSLVVHAPIRQIYASFAPSAFPLLLTHTPIKPIPASIIA